MRKNIKANFYKMSLVSFLVFTLIAASFMTPAFSFAAEPADENNALVFENTGEGDDAISLTEERSFTVKVKVDMTEEDLQKAIDDDKIQWKLSRDEGMQDPAEFPYQYLGGPLADWKTIKTAGQEEIQMFQNIENTVVTDTDDVFLQMTFDAKTLFGYNGIDNRDRQLVRNMILDYVGEYDLTCSIDGKALAAKTIWVNTYDIHNTQDMIDEKLFEYEERANKAGLYSEVQTIGMSVEGRPIYALFLAASKDDLSNHLALTEQAETNPEALQEQVNAGTLDYKVPVIYSNIHSDEIIGADACINFIKMMVEAAEDGSGKIPYNKITDLTEEGKTQLAAEMEKYNVEWSELIADKVKGIGFIREGGTVEETDTQRAPWNVTVDLSDELMEKYYNIEEVNLDVEEILDNMFFIVVPSENPDGRANMVRANANYFDLNRDNAYQTQPETQAMTSLIAKWNPITLYELHGYYNYFVIEPNTAPHEPNMEYDLYIDTAIEQGENFGAAVIANNDKINSFTLAARDYFRNGQWGDIWEDLSPSYTPIYAFLHGATAYTAEFPYGSYESAVGATYAFISNADFIKENKDRMYLNQLEFFERGVNNIDSDELDKYFTDQQNNPGAEADMFRPKYAENNNFFPEYYIIPIDAAVQKNTAAAKEIVEMLLRNDVALKQLTEDVTINGKTYNKGSIVVDMHQAKRNVANSLLYSNLVVDTWSALYSEPLTAHPQCRGFDTHIITTIGAIEDSQMKEITTVPSIETDVSGEGEYVILSNNSVDSIKAVNSLLKNNKEVSMITDGENKGDFLIAESDFNTVKDNYILKAEKVSETPEAKLIKQNIKIYIPGRSTSDFASLNGQSYGVKGFPNMGKTALGWDLFAFGEQMEFEIVDNAKDADVIVGSQSLSAEEKELVKNGMPYVGYTSTALGIAKELIGIDYTRGGSYDALTTITYEDDSLITANYVREEDFIMYGYGGSYITTVPEGADVLIKTTSDRPIEGFMTPDWIESYKNTIQAIDYSKDDYNLTIFANTMTNKAHQTDDYRYLTNAIYSKLFVDNTSEDTPGDNTSGGSVPPATPQEPIISTGDGYTTTLSTDGKTVTITVDEGYEIVDVTVNGVSKGAVTELTGLKTGDKVVITTKKIETPDDDAALIEAVKNTKLVARSVNTKAPSGKKAIKVYWYAKDGSKLNFDGYEIYRSTKKNSGYGTKPIYKTTKSLQYFNTSAKKGTRYYYKVRGYKEIGGERFYTPYSLKAIRTAK